MLKFHQMKLEEVEQTLHTNITHGLTRKAVHKKREKFGWNELSEGSGRRLSCSFLTNLKILWCLFFWQLRLFPDSSVNT